MSLFQISLEIFWAKWNHRILCSSNLKKAMCRSVLFAIFHFSSLALSNNPTPSCVIITMNSLLILILCVIVIMLLLPPTVFSYLLLTILDFHNINLPWRLLPDNSYLPVFQRTTGGHVFPPSSCPWSFELSVVFNYLC